MTPLWITGMQGLGDNLFQRPVLREAVKTRTVYLTTPWPQLYMDIPVRCVKPEAIRLRTQAKNAERPATWWTPSGIVDAYRMHYVNRDGTMLEGLCESIGVKADTLDFSGPPVAKVGRVPYIVVRPVTRRTEWQSESREPLPEYIAQAVEALRARYWVVSVADIAPPHEVAIGALPYADETYHRGELPVEQLLALVAGAAAVVGGVGWLVPAAVAYRMPMLLLFGGWLVANGPARIFDRRMDTSRIQQVFPDAPCMCSSNGHQCSKTVSNLERHLERFVVGLAAGEAAAVAA